MGASLSHQPSADAGSDVTVLAHATVIDATGAPPRRNATVVLAGDRIVYVGDRRHASVPAGARVIDLDGKYVIPGLWDLHTHYGFSEDIFIPLYIANGVTGIREMWGYAEIHATRRRIESGQLLGPRMIVASSIIDGPNSVWAGPYPSSTVVDTDAEARAAVRQAKAEGADFLKVYSYLSRECLAAIADEGRRLGLPVAGHLPWRLPAVESNAAGLRCFEHLYGMPIATSSREQEILQELADTPIDPANPRGFYNLARELDRQASDTFDPAKAARLYARLRRNGAWQSPTLTVLRVFASPADTYVNDPRLKYIPPDLRAYWAEYMKAVAPSTPEQIAQQAAFLRFRLRMVGAMHRSGVGVIGGTDCANPYAFPGFGAHDELSLLVEAGLTPLQALQAMTRDAARYLGLERTTGTVTAGRTADLVVLDADPLANIENSQQIHAVVTRGRLIDHAERQQLLADVEAAANGGGGTGDPLYRLGCGCSG
jgi:cytosine/adenosine deaminase-related metal-dependent hydrolase